MKIWGSAFWAAGLARAKSLRREKVWNDQGAERRNRGARVDEQRGDE